MTADLPATIGSYSRPLQPDDFDDIIRTHVVESKFLCGNSPVTGTAPLVDVLLAHWPCDLHFTLYTSTQAVRCLKSDVANYDLAFRFAAVDCDFDKHTGRPTRQNFADLLRTLHVMDEVPNVVYETRGGCRLIYVIEPLFDAGVFEGHYGSLLARLKQLFINANNGYAVDTAAKDWTRLFRAPLVIRSGVQEYDRLVEKMHEDVLDLTDFRVKKPRVRKPVVGNQPYRAGDLRLIHLLTNEMVEGRRNSTVFQAVCHTLRTYNAAAAEQWIETIRDAALSAGISEIEVGTVIKSAIKTEGTK
jgi:hypothetical protein